MVKICAAAKNLDTRVYFGMSGWYNQPVQYGRDAAHKSRAAWAFRSLEVYMSERQHIYEDLNESSSARPGGSQRLEILPSPNSKRTPNFSADIVARREDFNVRQDSIIRLYFYQTPIFCIPAEILGCTYNTQQCFGHPPIFQASANIFMRRLDFRHPPIF